MIAGIILLAIAILIMLLLSLKMGVRILFGEELRIFVKAGPLMLLVYPRPEKKSPVAEKTKSAEKTEETKRNITLDAIADLLRTVLPLAMDAMERVRKDMHIQCFLLRLTISDLDPAEAARRYGTCNAVLWPLLACVENLVAVEKRDVKILLDFAAQKSSAAGELFVTMRLRHGLRIALKDGVPMLRAVLQFLKTVTPKKTGAKVPPENAEKQTTAAA